MRIGITLSKRRASALAIGVGCTLLAWALAAGAALAQDSAEPESSSSSRIVGVWGVTVTLRDCATGAPLGPPFPSLLTFEDGGAISESTGAPIFAPNQRTEGHGVWRKLTKRKFSQRTIALLRFETQPQPPLPGFLAGWQVIDQTITMSDRNHFTSEGTGDFYDVQGELYRTGCSSAVGERFE